MYRILCFAVCLTCCLWTNQVLGQKVKQRIPIITLGHLPRPQIKDGKPLPLKTTRRVVLRDYLLLADVNNCRVTEYKLSIIAPGKGFYGPIYVTGPELTDSIMNKIKQLDGPDVKIYIEDVRMNYRGDTMNANSVLVTYDE